MSCRVLVYIACSLDGFIAGPDGDLSWLPVPPEGEDYGWGDFIGAVGCLLVGRGTYDAVAAMGIAWPHAERDTLVATTRPLSAPPARVTAASGPIDELVRLAKGRAGERNVYVDGGSLVRQALDADLVDAMTVTLCPVILGRGQPLFAGAASRHRVELKEQRRLPPGLVQLTYVPLRR